MNLHEKLHATDLRNARNLVLVSRGLVAQKEERIRCLTEELEWERKRLEFAQKRLQKEEEEVARLETTNHPADPVG